MGWSWRSLKHCFLHIGMATVLELKGAGRTGKGMNRAVVTQIPQKLQSLQKESSSTLYQMISVMNHQIAVMISVLVERVNIQSIKHKFKMDHSFREEWRTGSLVRESDLNGHPIWNSVRGEGLYRPGDHNGT